jgi:single-strand DNA-binding protein
MNVVALSGNLTRDPESRSTQAGKNVCSFSLAINEGKDKTEFVNCVAWEKTAELIAQYCKKGDRIAATGRLQTRKWQDSEGKDRYATEVIVSQFDFPPKTSSGLGNQGADQTNYSEDAPF